MLGYGRGETLDDEAATPSALVVIAGTVVRTSEGA
jgi:hypothetical protein